MRDANLRAFHNTVRKLYNIEWEQLGFLTDVQKDNFFENPPMFFIRADDETATKLWDIMHPKAPEPAAGEAAKDSGAAKVIDLDTYRRVIDALRPPEPVKRTFEYRYNPVTDFEYDTGRVYPLTAGKSAEPAGIGGAWTPGYYDRAG